MKQVQVGVTFKPLGLLLQIDPNTGKFMEATLISEAQFGGAHQRHETWWKDMSEGAKEVAQELVDEAVDTALTEDGINS